MPQRQAAGGAGVDAVELASHRHADGLKSFEAGPALGDMPTEQLGVPVLGDAEQPDLAVLDGGDLGRVGRPHHIRRLGGDPPIVRRVVAERARLAYCAHWRADKTPALTSFLKLLGERYPLPTVGG